MAAHLYKMRCFGATRVTAILFRNVNIVPSLFETGCNITITCTFSNDDLVFTELIFIRDGSFGISGNGAPF